MSDAIFEQVVQLAEQLTPEERAALVDYLQSTQPTGRLTLADIQAEHRRRLTAGAFVNQESLYGKYAAPAEQWGDGELEAYRREIGSQWEDDLDDLISDD